jgi:fructose-specific phosphotransferase system IIA component
LLQLHTVFDPAFIDLDLQAADKAEAIGKLAARLDAAGVLADREGYVQAVFAREALTSTGVGMGVAIPHGKSDAVRRAAVALGRTGHLTWDGEPVRLVFLLAVPEHGAATDHLEILAALAQLLLEDSFRHDLLQAATAEEALDIITTHIRSMGHRNF